MTVQEKYPTDCSQCEDWTEFESIKLRDAAAGCFALQLHVHRHLGLAAGFQIQPPLLLHMASARAQQKLVRPRSPNICCVMDDMLPVVVALM